ncbi:hypothetical protein ANN_04313, partial [Periplaneta americana]
ELGAAEVNTAEMSRSKSCDGKLDDTVEVNSSMAPVTTATTTTITTTTAVGQTSSGSNQTVLETSHQPIVFELHENHGRNVQLGEGRRTAKRTASYNQGVVISSKPLPREQLFQVRVDSLNSRWVSSLMCGVTCQSPEKTHFPLTALGFKKNSWIICSDCVFHNGIKVKGCYGPNLDSLQSCHLVGVLVDSESRLHLYVNGVDQGVAACDIPSVCYAVVDVYGQCEEVTIMNLSDDVNQSSVQASLVPSTIEATSSLDATQDQTQLESESLSEKADLECDEKEKLSELLASCGSGENSFSHRGGENMLTSSSGEFQAMGAHLPSPLSPYTNTTSPICPPVVTNTNLKSLSIPISQQISTSTVVTPPSLPLSNASNVVPVVSNATNVSISNMNSVPNVTTNVGSDTNLTATISDSNVDAVLNDSTVMNASSTHIPTPGAISAQMIGGSTAPASPVSTAPMASAKNCEYLNACSRFKSLLGLPEIPRKSAVAKFRLLTEYDYLAKHLNKIVIYTNPNCPLCNKEEEMTEYHLITCEVLPDGSTTEKYWRARTLMASLPKPGIR